MGYQVFLSHSTKDRKLVSSIRNALEDVDISVYLAEEHLQLGKNLPKKIIQNIKSSDCMVVVLTDMGNRSQFVNQEIGAARMARRTVIPMVEKKIERKIGGLLAGLEYILFDKSNPREAINKVVSYLSHLKGQLELEIRKKEDIMTAVTVVSFVVIFAIILYFAFRRK